MQDHINVVIADILFYIDITFVSILTIMNFKLYWCENVLYVPVLTFSDFINNIA